MTNPARTIKDRGGSAPDTESGGAPVRTMRLAASPDEDAWTRMHDDTPLDDYAALGLDLALFARDLVRGGL